jgi:hypothetical protein
MTATTPPAHDPRPSALPRSHAMPVAHRPVIVIVLLIASVLGACAPKPVTSALTEAQARALADGALQGFAAGDYARWSRDWSDAMKASIGESAFLAFREQATSAYGRFLSISDVQLAAGKDRGYVRWNVTTVFERGRLRFGFAFQADGTTVEGVFPEPLP